MCHLHPRTLSAAATLAIIWAGVASSQIAARIEGQEISIAEVDAFSGAGVQQLRGRLMEVTQQAVRELIDRQLGIPAAAPPDERARIYRAHQVRLVLPEAQALESPLPPEQVIAFVGKDAIKAAAVEQAAALRLYRLRGELYLQRRRDLNPAIETRLLQSEAQRRGVSVQELEKSLASTEAPTDAEVAKFVASERAAGRVVESPERVRPYLAFQKAYQRRSSLLETLRARTQIHVDLRPPTRPRLPVDTDGGLVFGAGAGRFLWCTRIITAQCAAPHTESLTGS